MRRGPELIVAIFGLLGIAAALWLAAIWTLMGMPPHEYVTRLVYRTMNNDVPYLELPLKLATSEPFTFRARIVEKRQYWLNLRVYFDSSEQRLAVAKAVGDFASRPRNVNPPGAVTVFRVEVRDREQRIVHESIPRSEGRESTIGDSLGRRLDAFVLDKGIYDISVAPLSDVSAFAGFRTSLKLTYQPNSTPFP